MNILHEETGAKGRYHVTVEGHEAEVTYSRASPQLVIVDHTGVPDALRGKGIGQALIEAVYERARAEGSKEVYWMTQDFNATARRLYDRIAEKTPFIIYQKNL